MPSTETFGEIKGLPSGATVEPIVASNGTIRGLPAGAVVEPIAKATGQAKVDIGNKPPASVAGLPQGATLHPVEPTPQEKILQATVGEGYTQEDAQRRVHEYDYAIQQGLSPERAEKFASALKLKATKKVLTPEERQNVSGWYASLPIEERKKGFVDAVTDPQEFANGYAEARAMGMNEGEAVEYGQSQPSVRAAIRATNWAGDKYTNAKKGMLWLLGARDEVSHVKAEDAVSGSLIPTLMGRASQDQEFQTQKSADWTDKHAAHWMGVLQEHIDHLIEGFTNPDMAALEAVTFGGGAVEGMLPEVVAEATAGTRATRFAQRAIRTTSKLSHIGFTTMMAEGTLESGSESVKQFAKGNVSEGMGYLLDAIVNGFMATTGARSVDAHAEVHSALDAKTGEIFSGKKFDQLSDQQQGLIVNRLIEDDPKFKSAMDASEKQAQKAAKKLQRRYGEAAWNPNAAQRAVNALHAERAETARKEQVQRGVDTLKARVKQRTEELKAEEEERQAAVREGREERRKTAAEGREAVQQTAEEIAKGREETFANRQSLDEIPTEEQTARHVEANSDESGHITYPVQYWGETNKFGVGTDGERHSVYRQTPRGVEWLDRNGNFTETPESLYYNADAQTSDTVARLSSLKLEADGLAAQPEATAEQVKDAETLGEIRRQLIDGEINVTEAQKRAGIAEKVRLPDVNMAAREGRLNGPFHEKSAVDYEHEVVLELLNSGASEEEVQATLESLPELARVQIESNLHHVYESGDYIISKRGLTWTLDSRGMLHPDDGGHSVPLMKRGRYSNQAMHLAASGRIGYGEKSYEEATKEPTPFGAKLRAAIKNPVKKMKLAGVPETALDRVAREVERSAETSKPKTIEDAIYEYAIPRNMDPHTLASDISNKFLSTRNPEERAFLANYVRWEGRHPLQKDAPITALDEYDAELIRGVVDRMEGKVKDSEPKTQVQANVQAAAAEERKTAAHVQAVEADYKAVNPEIERDDTPEKAAEKADELAKKAEEAKKVAKEAAAQAAEAKAKVGPKGDFPQRYVADYPLGKPVIIEQNGRQFKAHYRLVPVGAVIISHTWQGDTLVRTPEELYPKVIQPREPNERTILQRRIDAQMYAVSKDGVASGYNFDKYANPALDAMSGPTVVEKGLRSIAGTGRFQRFLYHIKVLNEISYLEERTAALEGIRSRLVQLAKDSGFYVYPEDGQLHIVVRELDKPIETLEEASKYGLLLNESEADNISDSQKGLVYGRSFDQDLVNKIGRLVEDSSGGLNAAMRKNPAYFAEVVAARFDIPTSQSSLWFTKDRLGNDVLTDEGEKLFRKAMVGYAIEDPDLLEAIKDDSASRAFENAIGYVSRLKVFKGDGLDLTEQIKDALRATALTTRVDPDLSANRDRWEAVYAPSQIREGGFLQMEREIPPEPSRPVEAIWRALHASDVAAPRAFSDKLKLWISAESTQSGMFDSTEKALEKPVDKFNRVFSKELKETALRRNRGTDKAKTSDGWMLSQNDYDAALRGQDVSDEERAEEKKPEPEVKAEAKPVETPKFGPPPKTSTPMTSQTFREKLHNFSTTKAHAESIFKVAKAIARVRWERTKPEGVERTNALDWMLKEINFRGIEKGNDPNYRGEYDFATGIMRMNEAADETTFIHEFTHAIAPLLTEDEWKQIDTIKVNKAKFKQEYGRDWVYTGKNERMEKLAYGTEKFLRDENAYDFRIGPEFELRKVLKDIKEMFVSVFRDLQSDPLSPFKLTEDAKQWMVDNLGITGLDEPDVWRRKVEKARAEEKAIRPPKEAPDPLIEVARKYGGIERTTSINGDVEQIGNRVDPKKNIATVTFPSEDAALAFSTDSKISGSELIRGKDGTFAVKFNASTKLHQSLPVQSLKPLDLSLQREELHKRLSTTPSYKTFERRLVQDQIDRIEARISREAGRDEPEPQRDTELPKKVMEEVRNAKATDRGRAANDDTHGLPKPPRVGGIPQPPKLGVSGHAGAKRGGAASGSAVPRAPVSLENVRPVNLEPLSGVRGEPVGTTHGEKFDQKAWVEGLKRAGLPESTPAPTYSLDPKTAAQLIYPGQKQIVQTVMSGLDQGDSVAVVTPPGTGKTYLGNAVIKEFLRNKPDASVLIVSKNKGLIRKSKRVAASTFGFDVELDVPEGQPGVYGASYKGLLDNDIYKNSKWDLVVADEAGEARRWYDDTTQQGQMLRDVVANSGKAVYMSATPFHSPMEYGYLDKLNLWPKGQFDKWIQENFAHEKVGDKIIARLDPGKQAKLREQLIERGQFVSQAISYDGYNAHFGVVPVTDSMKRGLDRIREGFSRARDQFVRMGKQGLARKTAAFEAVYTKNFLERERLPQAIELAKQARAQGWRVLFFSEHTADDLFRRERTEGEEASTYQQLDDAMGGQLSRIIPAYPSIYDELFAEFGTQVGDYSGRGNTDAAREKTRTDFLKGEVPMMYSSYAGGGIGVDMHDADYPELNVKGGDKPIVAIYLGPPYSGVLLEQAMGRPWRFGVKSDVHAVFLATDSEPDIRLMQTKVGPRMKALRAAVLGETDSLANVMSTYTDEEKVRERQDQLAYAEGNEMKVNATQFQVSRKSRNVGIQDWSAIRFPSAEEAKNKGMKYGEDVTGGDWSSLYQSKFELRPPDDPNTARGKAEIDRLGNAVASGKAAPPELQNLEPAEVKTAVGLSAATATTEVDLPLDRDKTNTARQSMDSQLRNGRPFHYYGLVLSQELGMENIARHAGKPEVGKALKLMNRNMRADYDVMRSQYWNLMEDAFKRNGIKTTDKKAVRIITRVLEGKESSADPKINAIAADLSDMMRMSHEDLSKAGVGVRDHTGKIVARYGKDFGEDPHYFPHRIDWDQEVTDPKTGKTMDLREMMKAKNEEIRKRIIANIPELKSYTYQQVYDYMNRHTPKAPVLSNIHRAREVNFPFIKRDYETLVGYFDQVAEATAQAKNFGPENEKLNHEIRKIDDINSIETLQSMFRSTLEPQNWNDVTAKIYNAAVAYEAASKMTFSAFKVPFHLGLVPLGMEGRVLPLAKAFAHLAMHPREVMENAGYVGVLTRQLNAADIMFGERQASPVRQILKKELFEASYKMVRALSGESARVYLDQYAIRDLKRGGRDAQNTRRLLSETFLIGDGSIDEAVANGRFSPDDIGRAQTAFANLTTFSDDPLQMPQLARLEMAKGEARPLIGLKRAVRLTYALQSFSLKATSLLREKLYDEVVIHKNYRPLAYALIASPIIGQMLQATGTGAKHVIHKGFEGLTGRKHEKDSWDAYIANMKQTFEHPEAADLLKFIVDGYTLGYGWDMVRTVVDPFIDIAGGNLKKSGQEFKYMGTDIIEHLIGPFFDDCLKSLEEVGRIGQIESGRKNPLQKPKKVKQSVGKYLEGQVPALRTFPPFEDVFGIKPPPK